MQWLGIAILLLDAPGLAIGFSSLAGLLGVVLLSTGFLLRSQVEERMIIRVFGEQYITYARRTGRMVPRIYHPARKKLIGKHIP